MEITCGTPTATSSFDYSWPEALEHFERAWRVPVVINGKLHAKTTHGLGDREVYGRHRPHSVTFVNGQPRVEGVATDDFDRSGQLISRIKRADNKTARSMEQVPRGLERFEIVDHRSAIDAPHSPRCLAVAIHQEDAASWAYFAIHRAMLLGRL